MFHVEHSTIISICNQKGGVGKTTTAVNLGAALALSGCRVLLVDLDPQGNATSGLGIEKKNLGRSVYDLLLGRLSLEEAVISTKVQNLSLVPSSVALSGAEVELVQLPEREHRLKTALKDPQRAAYDLVLIDSPPSLGLLTLNALVASDSVLIPLQCEYYALEGLSQLLETIRLVQEGLNSDLSIEGVLLTMADFRTRLTSDVIQEVRRFFGSKVYDVVIPRSVRLSEAPSHGVPIALFDPGSAGARAYQSLAEKIIAAKKEEKDSDVGDQGARQGDPGAHPGEHARLSGEAGLFTSSGSSERRGDRLGSNRIDPDRPVPASEETG